MYGQSHFCETAHFSWCHGKLAMYRVKSGAMSKAGYKFYLSVNGVWLTKAVPTEYLEQLY